MTQPLLIVFSKAPYFGGAKSRLAAGIGKVHANRLYRAMVCSVLRRVQDPRWKTVIACATDKDMTRSFGGVWPYKYARMSQGKGSLSPRLTLALSRQGPTVVIGTDAPQISRRDIAAAFKALRRAPAVFGPADDGGFWLIGMNGRVDRSVFDGVNWSTQTALSDVAANIDAECCYLRTLIDVDDIKALKAVRSL